MFNCQWSKHAGKKLNNLQPKGRNVSAFDRKPYVLVSVTDIASALFERSKIVTK